MDTAPETKALETIPGSGGSTPNGYTIRTRKAGPQLIAVTPYHHKQQVILTKTIDEVETEIDLAMYDRMETDSTIAKDKKILVSTVLSDELQLAPGATEEEVPEDEFEVYMEIMQFCERIEQGLDSSLRSTNEQWFGNAIKYGHGISEIEWEYRDDEPTPQPKKDPKPKVKAGLFERVKARFMGQPMKMAESDKANNRPSLKGKRTKLMPKSLKVKPRGSAQFVTDEFMTVLGLLPTRKFSGTTTIKYDEIIDREKFMILTLNKQNEDPRGRSSYRAAYNWYNLKVQLPAEMLRFILEESVPKAVATLPSTNSLAGAGYEQAKDENGNPKFDGNGEPVMQTLVESMLDQIYNFRSGAGAVIPYEAKLEPYKKGLTGANDPLLFKHFIKMIDDQIEGSILNQTMAQSEGDNQGRSASEQVAEILYVLQFWNRLIIAETIRYDLFRTAVKVNYGEWALKYLPKCSLGDFVRRDWVKELAAIADAYFKGFIDDSQRQELCSLLNLPKPGPSRQELEMEQGAKLDVNGNPIQNNTQRPDKQTGNKNRNNGNGTEKKS